MKTEVSAGGVVVQKSKTGWNVLIIKDMNGQWTFPKGIVESGEDFKDAAAREISEETGLSGIQYLSLLPSVSYMYQRNGLISKTVHYFVFRYPSDEHKDLKPQINEGISDVQWTKLDKAADIIGYPKTNKKLLQKTRTILLHKFTV